MTDSKRTSTTFNWTQVRVMEHRHPEAAKTQGDAEGLRREEAANSTPKQNQIYVIQAGHGSTEKQ